MRVGLVAGALLGLVTGACSGSKSNGASTANGGSGGAVSPGSGAGTGSTAAGSGGPPCSDLFDQGMLRTYSLEIAPDVMSSIQAELQDMASLTTKGNDFVARHPIVFHMGSETVSDATFKLHGQSSWAQTVMLDGDRQKMQFDVSFHQSDPNGKFHGVEKLVFDMPRSDWTFMHDRLAHAWLRQIGITAGCAANARVEINGAYYGLYVAEENTGKRVITEFFPNDPNGDLWKGGIQPETNKAPDWSRQMAFWNAKDFASVSAIVDLPTSVQEWAAEALLNSADNWYGGTHNFYLYDTGAKGFVFLPNDTDSTFEWMTLFDDTGVTDHPLYWWEGKALPAKPGDAWLAMINDPATRKSYVDAIATQLSKWNVGQLQGWIDAWSQQIDGAMTSDPHTWATPAQFHDAVGSARDVVAKRAQFLQSFVDCERNGAGDDKDGDGARWCDDCRDDDPNAHPGAHEICGNGVDDDCNGVTDDGC